MGVESDWYRCGHCTGLFHAAGAEEPAAGACTHRRGPHRAAEPREQYALTASAAPDGVQDYWQECRHCRGLFFAGPCEPDTSLGICPGRAVGEPHEPVEGGAVYHLPRAVDSERTEWSRCRRCWALVRDDGHESTCAWPRFTHVPVGGRYRPARVPTRDADGPPATRMVAFRRRIAGDDGTSREHSLVALAHPALDGQPHAIVGVTPDASFPRGELAPVAVVRAVVYLDREAVLPGLHDAAARDRWYVWLERAAEGMVLNVVAAVPEP